MTREEFIAFWTANAVGDGATEEDLRRIAPEPEPCACGEAGCLGWRMVLDGERGLGDDLGPVYRSVG